MITTFMVQLGVSDAKTNQNVLGIQQVKNSKGLGSI
jgi:DNA-binding transcriptional regulator YdaS (Cro superfamily)